MPGERIAKHLSELALTAAGHHVIIREIRMSVFHYDLLKVRSVE